MKCSVPHAESQHCVLLVTDLTRCCWFGLSFWRGSRARGGGAPPNSAAVETIPLAASRIESLSSQTFGASRIRPLPIQNRHSYKLEFNGIGGSRRVTGRRSEIL